jgi:hypothetical protein
MKRTSLACKFHYTNPKRYYYLYPFASHAIHLRGLAKVSLNALPRFSSTFEYDTKRCENKGR